MTPTPYARCGDTRRAQVPSSRLGARARGSFYTYAILPIEPTGSYLIRYKVRYLSLIKLNCFNYQISRKTEKDREENSEELAV